MTFKPLYPAQAVFVANKAPMTRKMNLCCNTAKKLQHSWLQGQ